MSSFGSEDKGKSYECGTTWGWDTDDSYFALSIFVVGVVCDSLTCSLSDVHSSKGVKLQRRGGGGGFGYQKSKHVHKSKIFKHVNKGRGDRRQFSRWVWLFPLKCLFNFLKFLMPQDTWEQMMMLLVVIYAHTCLRILYAYAEKVLENWI